MFKKQPFTIDDYVYALEALAKKYNVASYKMFERSIEDIAVENRLFLGRVRAIRGAFVFINNCFYLLRPLDHSVLDERLMLVTVLLERHCAVAKSTEKRMINSVLKKLNNLKTLYSNGLED